MNSKSEMKRIVTLKPELMVEECWRLKQENEKFRKALLFIASKCPHWDLCNALSLNGNPRVEPDHSKCDCHRDVARNVL